MAIAPPTAASTDPQATQAPTIQPVAQQGLAPMTPPAVPAPTPMPAAPPQLGAASPPAPPTVGYNGGQVARDAPPGFGQTPPVGAVPGAATSSFGPGNDLRGSQITPTTDPRLAGTQGAVDAQAGKLANGPDRFQIAQDRFKTYNDATDPAFQASIRSATQHAAANGAVGSGELGTDYGNLALAHTRDLANERSNLFSNALEGTIGDTRANVGLLSGLEGQQYGQDANNRAELRGERGYQNGMEQQAYDRGVQGLTLEDALTNSAFGRGQAQSQAGEANNPANTQMLLSGLYGQQAAGAGQALSGLVQNTATNNAVKGAYGQPTAHAPLPPGQQVDGGPPGYQSPLLSGLS